MVTAIGYLGVSLFCAWLMARLYLRRGEYSDEDKDRWSEEFNNNSGHGSPWPYTKGIERLGKLMRELNTFGPLLAGLFLIASMLFTQ